MKPTDNPLNIPLKYTLNILHNISLINHMTNSNNLSDKWFLSYLGVFSYFQVPLQEGIYREDDIGELILEVICKAIYNKSKLKKYFKEIFEIRNVL
ncbi:MAG: hypothetical protein QXJ93_02125 [Candidatus Rehaiarchaeum fermentans]|nr:hypothetical protein [Candidatus Rehaiarchaeum fermentans]